MEQHEVADQAGDKGVDPVGDALLEELAAAEQMRARAEAEVARLSVAYREHVRRRAECEAISPKAVGLATDIAADEIGYTLRTPSRTVHESLARTVFTADRLPRLWRAHTDGFVDAYRVRLIAQAAGKLVADASVARLDAAAADYAATHTTAQLRAWLRRFLARTEPEHFATRTRRAFADRDAWFSHDDGIAWLNAMLSAGDASRLETLLDQAARSVSDERTLAQRRADILADILLGRRGWGIDGELRNPEGRVAGARAVIGVTIPALSLAGLSEEPGADPSGEYLYPAEVVRELASQPGTLFYRLIHDPLGRILDATELGRFPSRSLRDVLRFRDGTCAFPTCSRPVEVCDVDHSMPFPDGRTSADNLRHLCRRHHRLKTVGVVRVDYGPAPPPDDRHRWHLPSGRMVASTAAEPFGPPERDPERFSPVELALRRAIIEYRRDEAV